MRSPATPRAASLRTSLAAGRDHHAAPLVGAGVATVLWSMGNLIASGASLPGPQLAFWRVLFGALAYQAVFHLRGGRMSARTFRTAALGASPSACPPRCSSPRSSSRRWRRRR